MSHGTSIGRAPSSLVLARHRVVVCRFFMKSGRCVPLEAEYKVTAVQVSPSNGPSDWRVDYLALSAENRRIEVVPAGE
jgi:hypothetical protein